MVVLIKKSKKGNIWYTNGLMFFCVYFRVSKDNVLPLPWILVGVVLLFICLFIACCVVWCRNRRNFKRSKSLFVVFIKL